MLPKTVELQKEIQRLNKNLQAAGEIDGYFYSAHRLLANFTIQDWEKLKVELRSWRDEELTTLALTLKDRDGFGNLLDDNGFYLYIFTMVGVDFASELIDDMFFLFEETQVKSADLLDSMKTKVQELKSKGYIDDTYEFWMKTIEVAKKESTI